MKSKQRQAKLERKSTETQIKVELNIDGRGKSKIKTPIGLLTHMLELFAFHGFFDLTLEVKGDTHVDIHHTNEDIGIALGKIFKKALGDNNLGIKRFGSAFAPMENTLGHTVIDLSGRGYLTLVFKNKNNETYNAKLGEEVESQLSFSKQNLNRDLEDYKLSYLEHFLESFANNLGATVNVKIEDMSDDIHTNLETVFKSLGMALEQATRVDPRRKGNVPSTKGIID